MSWHWVVRRTDQARDHVGEAGLVAVSCASGDQSVLSESERAHLSECAGCRARLNALAQNLDDWSAAAAAEADAAFPADRLERQRHAILRRIAFEGQSARVLPFPSARSRGPAVQNVARRWVAAAAVAGLCVGLLTGRALRPWPETTSRSSFASASPRPASAGRPLVDPSLRQATTLVDQHDVDEAFLHELDLAIMAPRIAPLEALDALTPQQPEAGPR